jgi:DNA-binding NtrC family response regulator
MMSTLLVIDDDRLHCDLLQMALARHGYQVSIATSGREGVVLFQQLRPLVTLLDLRMPEMDGLAVLKEIRTHDPRAGVIMLGGGATEELENQARELRVTDFLRKGLSLDVLIGAVHRVAQQARRQASSEQSHAGGEIDQLPDEQILVVDDDVMARDLLVRFLSLRGYHVRTARDGREALRLIGESAPDLLILDLAMPEMNGVEVLRTLTARDYAGRTIILGGHQNDLLPGRGLGVGPARGPGQAH